MPLIRIILPYQFSNSVTPVIGPKYQQLAKEKFNGTLINLRCFWWLISAYFSFQAPENVAVS